MFLKNRINELIFIFKYVFDSWPWLSLYKQFMSWID